MRKPSKLRNHLLMPLGKIQIIGKQCPITLRLLRNQFDMTRNAFVLHRKVLAVLEYQQDEHSLNR